MLFRNQFTSYKKDKDKLNSNKFQKNSFEENKNTEKEIFLDKLMNSNSGNLKKDINDLLKNENNNYYDLNYYNFNWEDDFRKEGLSLEDDGNYDYIDGDDKMALEYFNGELPKTKISKNKSKSRSGAEVRDSQQLVNDELVNLKNESAVVQKAWLANNNRINELIEIVEAQEKELKQLRLKNSPNFSDNNFENLIERVKKLEKNNDLGSSSEDQASLEKLRKENQKLRDLLEITENKKFANESISNINLSKDPELIIEEKKFKKRKQAHFFVIKEKDFENKK